MRSAGPAAGDDPPGLCLKEVAMRAFSALCVGVAVCALAGESPVAASAGEIVDAASLLAAAPQRPAKAAPRALRRSVRDDRRADRERARRIDSRRERRADSEANRRVERRQDRRAAQRTARRVDHRLERQQDRRSQRRDALRDRVSDSRDAPQRLDQFLQSHREQLRSRFDADGDGALSEQELARARRANHARRAALRAALDRDNDGAVGDAEWRAFAARFASRADGDRAQALRALWRRLRRARAAQRSDVDASAGAGQEAPSLRGERLEQLLDMLEALDVERPGAAAVRRALGDPAASDQRRP